MEETTRPGPQDPWHPLPGFATDVGAGGGTVWMIGKSSNSSDFGLYRWDEAHQAWVQEPTGTAGMMAAGAPLPGMGPAGGLLSAVQGAAGGQAGSEERPRLGENSSIAADGHGRPWVTDEARRTFRLNGLTWELLPGANTDIDLGGDTAWGIGTGPSAVGGCSLYRWDETGRTWHRDSFTYGVRIAVDDQGIPWHINTEHGIYRGIANSVRKLAGTGRDIGAGGGSIWVIGTDPGNGGFRIWKWDEKNSTWIPDAHGFATRITVDSNGRPWAVNSNGNIFRKS